MTAPPKKRARRAKQIIVATHRPLMGAMTLPLLYLRVEPPENAAGDYDIVAYPASADDTCRPNLEHVLYRWPNAALEHPVPMAPRLKQVDGTTYIAIGIGDNGEPLGLLPRGVRP